MPRGNKRIKEFGFKTDKPESLKAKLTVMLTQTMMDELNLQENKAEFVREAIKEKLERENQVSSPSA